VSEPLEGYSLFLRNIPDSSLPLLFGRAPSLPAGGLLGELPGIIPGPRPANPARVLGLFPVAMRSSGVDDNSVIGL
jgi:hypothetical protein